MSNEFYDYSSYNLGKLYFFQSLGLKGKIVKVVKFSLIAPDRYNLGLADFEKGKLQDEVVSNNFDVRKVLSTVAEIIKHFTLENPQRTVVILATESRRAKIYNAVFNRREAEINQDFLIFGINEDDSEEPYDSRKSYKGFIVKRINLEL